MVQEVPGFLVADFLLLFPGVNVEGRGLNVITLSQRTINNMTGWSPDVEEEREKLLKHVSSSLTGKEGALDICTEGDD